MELGRCPPFRLRAQATFPHAGARHRPLSSATVAAPPARLGGSDRRARRSRFAAGPNHRGRFTNGPGRRARELAIGGRRRGCRRAGAAVLHRVGTRNAASRPRPHRPGRRRGQRRGNTRERRSPPHRELARDAPSADRHPSRAVGDHGCRPQIQRLATRSFWARPSPKAAAMRQSRGAGGLAQGTFPHTRASRGPVTGSLGESNAGPRPVTLPSAVPRPRDARWRATRSGTRVYGDPPRSSAQPQRSPTCTTLWSHRSSRSQASGGWIWPAALETSPFERHRLGPL